MKGSRWAAAVLLAACAALAASGAFAAPAADAPVSLDPPPGWTAFSPKSQKGVYVALRGPETSSFMVAAMPASARRDAASQRAFLLYAFGRLKGARSDYRADERLETQTFRNGVTARFLRAEAAGKPTLIVAAIDAGGPPLLATLVSAAPDAMMTPLIGALRFSTPAAGVHDSGVAVSLDGQLAIALGGGLRSRDLLPEEKTKGLVLAIQGAGSEVVFVKLEDDDAAPKDQPAIVRATAADGAKAALEKVSPARRARTAAGPSGVYAWAKVEGSPDLRFAAGFLPWAYWGYSVLGRGPQADELLVGAFAALKQGPRAVPKLVEASPRLDVPDEPLKRGPLLGIAVAAGALAVGLLAWSWRRKNATLPS